MESYLVSRHYDLITPDGKISSLKSLSPTSSQVTVTIDNISPAFVGYKIDKGLVFFNLKSTLAQLGLNAKTESLHLDAKASHAEVLVTLQAFGEVAIKMLGLLKPGAYIGKLFAADERRRVRDPMYLSRMFGRSDRFGSPLLSLGSFHGNDQLLLKKVEGRAVAFLSLIEGAITYDPAIVGILPALEKALHLPSIQTRGLVQLHQVFEPSGHRVLKDNILLVKTLPLHVRTVFGVVAGKLLPEGIFHTSASVLEPNTKESGDIYELFGSSSHELKEIPLEFYTLEPHREHIFFADRDQLLAAIEDPEALFEAFKTAPSPEHHLAAIFVVKGEQLGKLTPNDWIVREPHMNPFPGVIHPSKQAAMVESYIQEQPSYPFLKAIENDLITSEGILLTRYFPSPALKPLLLSSLVRKFLKRIYFYKPSLTYGDYFSHEDRSLLLDLAKFGIPTYWVDEITQQILQYIPKPGKDSGMFVPLNNVETFLRATLFGIYGSNLIEFDFEKELTELLKGILHMASEVSHPLLNPETPIALVTGGGPGSMSLGNRVAKSLKILSCANIMDFRGKKGAAINEQKQNPYIDGKMTYRLDRLIERQAEFNLDFPIFLMGGMGTDFEYCVEEVRRKVGSTLLTPVLLFGDRAYWEEKITPRFQSNLKHGTIEGSEWVSNCFYCVSSASQGLEVYHQFFSGTLKIGKDGPVYEKGFY
jgi:predicted Rossmann-fold nucleotide-binding protein